MRSEIQQAFADFASSSVGGTPASTQSTNSLVHTPPASSTTTSEPQVLISTSQSLDITTVPTMSTVPLGVLPAPAAITSVALTVPSSASGSTLPHLQAVVTPTSQAQSQTRGVILSPALQPIPAQLVQRIRANKFKEMRDLLIN